MCNSNWRFGSDAGKGVMKRHRIGLAILMAVVSLPASIRLFGQSQQQAPVVMAVVVNPLNPVDNISSADLYKIFRGEKQSWNTSTPVFPVVRAPQSKERDVLLSRVLKMNESEYRKHWVMKVYSGEVPREPLSLLSNGMQLEAVRAEKGGIALVNVQDVHEGVKILKVDGRTPTSQGYPLR